jgi:hypothetical protein
MASYRTWTVPLNPPNPYGTYLHSLAPIRPKDRHIYYTKYIIGVIGELTPSKAAVREWTYPSQLFTSSMTSAANLTHLERDPKSDDLWCLARDYHGALVKFNAATGVFTRYTTRAAGTPLIFPADLKFDGRGCIWLVGGTSGPALSTISRFEAASGKVTSWTIPATAMLNVSSIHPNTAGTKVWVSSVDTNLGSTRQWIGVLDVASGVLRCYSPTPYLSPPGSICIVLSEGDPEYVWFTATASADPVPPGIYRMDTAKEAFQKYESNAASLPRYIAIDAARRAWVTDIANNSVIHSEPEPCHSARFKKRNFKLKASQQRLETKAKVARVSVAQAPVQAATVQVSKHRCTTEFASSIQSPDHLRYQALEKRTALYLVNWGYNKIGLLHP